MRSCERLLLQTILEAGVKDNVLPTTAMAKVNFRIIPGETSESVAEYVRQTIDDDRVQVIEQGAGIASKPFQNIRNQYLWL